MFFVNISVYLYYRKHPGQTVVPMIFVLIIV